jgi:hypothetical protein
VILLTQKDFVFCSRTTPKLQSISTDAVYGYGRWYYISFWVVVRIASPLDLKALCCDGQYRKQYLGWEGGPVGSCWMEGVDCDGAAAAMRMRRLHAK